MTKLFDFRSVEERISERDTRWDILTEPLDTLIDISDVKFVYHNGIKSDEKHAFKVFIFTEKRLYTIIRNFEENNVKITTRDLFDIISLEITLEPGYEAVMTLVFPDDSVSMVCEDEIDYGIKSQYLVQLKAIYKHLSNLI
ncbi:MAG: hypothetical protein ACD_80C00075G0001 [uncultured bacterium (gcode 4)]|uniref:Uncharacterized protein n=1 Tax=uncultured bacterium (gcode 4) TaxID=1234023 RepID=K1YJ14_9BACT|nr:MAG: hypothetical protein ACD_80C00075G0001 [uncultured bacterium (gcode 4)]